MYTPDESKGHGEGNEPEQMAVHIGSALIPILSMQGGCDECRRATFELYMGLMNDAIHKAAQMFTAGILLVRPNTTVDPMSKDQQKEFLNRYIPNLDELMKTIVKEVKG